MARKKPSAPVQTPKPVSIESLLQTGKYADASRLAKHQYVLDPSEANHSQYKRVLRAAAESALAAGRPLNEVLVEADGLGADDSSWAVERAGWLARAGQVADALARVEPLNEPSARAKVLAHAVDRALRERRPDSLPAELHDGFRAAIAAFGHYAGGDDAAARDALQTIGLQSPFLEWKVLLRGLIAYSNNDDARAAENWQRLDPAYLPARLATPLRIVVDPIYRSLQSAEEVSALNRQLDVLCSSPLLDGLRAIRRELGREKSHSKAFFNAGAVIPLLRDFAPHLIPRLANCFYLSIVHRGEPDDMSRFKLLFGAPSDDPKFNRLQAIVAEQMKNWSMAHRQWKDYEAWFAANPGGWPADAAARARALIWNRMAEDARHYAEEQQEPDDMMDFFEPRRPKSRKVSSLDPGPMACLRKAIGLAPDWDQPNLGLIDALMTGDQPAEGEQAARAFLTRSPDNLEALSRLGSILETEHKFPEAAEVWMKASAVKPLDASFKSHASLAFLHGIRKSLVRGDLAEAASAFAARRDFLNANAPAMTLALQAIMALLAARTEEAERFRASAEAVPGQRVAVAYRMLVDGTLVKLKPARKTALTKRFKEALLPQPTLLEAIQFVNSCEHYRQAKIEYRGQQTHEKQALDQCIRCLKEDAPVEQFEMLAGMLVKREEWKSLSKLASACSRRFSTNPFFHYAEAVAMFNLEVDGWKIEGKLLKAKHLIQASPNQKNMELLELIEDLLGLLAGPFGLLDRLFGGFGAFDE